MALVSCCRLVATVPLRMSRSRLRTCGGENTRLPWARTRASRSPWRRLKAIRDRGSRPVRSAIRAAHDLHQLLDLAALICLVARGDGVLDAMRDVIAQDFLFEPSESRAHRRDLGHDVDAVAILFDHARNAAHLALDPAQPLRAGRLDIVTHARYIPLHGIGFNPSSRADRWPPPVP